MKPTSVIHKLTPSIINVLITFLLSVPFLLYLGPTLEWKFTWILIFLIYNIFFEFVFGRCIGMIIVGTNYAKQKSTWQIIIYSIFYTLSFTTLLFNIWFMFDLLLINLILLQLPSIIFTGTTLHGYLSGNVQTVQLSQINKGRALDQRH